MRSNLWKSLAGHRTLLILVVYFIGSTGLFVGLQYQQYLRYQASRVPQNIPLGTQNTPIAGGPSTVMESSNEALISVHLSEGKAQPQAAQALPVATGEPLTAEQAGQILSRLPTLEPQPGEQVDFKLPPDPLPPPRPGETIQESFPPAPEQVQPEPVESGPLKVLRFSPEGEIPIAPFVNITFNQPMVPLGTISSLSASQVPVRLDPPLEGTWRWLGTRTLNFQYDSALIDRLPKATVYHATIPAGTKSATGGILAETVAWSFSTPPPKMVFTYPYDEPQPLAPLFFIGFDQRITPQAVLDTIRVTAGGQPVSLKLVQGDAIQANEKWSGLLKNSQDGRWVAFQSADALPADTAITVTVGPGTPSAEGPLTTQSAQSYSFRTYAPFKVEEHGCAWGEINPGECQPFTPFFIRFNNPVDTKTYDESMIRIEPALPGANVNVIGNTVNIQGASQGQTVYTVTVSGSLQDTFGQKLGKDIQLAFRVGPANPMLVGPGQNFVTLDPAARPVLSLYAMNFPRLDLSIYAVQPSDWPAFKTYLRDFQRTDVKVQAPGRKVLEKSLPVEAVPNELTEVSVDLSPVMDGQFGQFIVIVRPPSDLVKNPGDVYWQSVQAWVQVTQIGLDAFADHSEMVAWATALKDGAPLDGVSISAGSSEPVAVTGVDGTARFPIPENAAYLVASQGADKALLPRAGYFWGDDVWQSRDVHDELRWYVFDDRGMYRPGEDVHVKGWLRRIGGRQDGDVGLVSDAVSAVSYRIYDPQNNPLDSGRVEVNALGGFDFHFSLPERVNLGDAHIEFNAEGSLSGLDGWQYYYNFQVQEFRRPEFEVNARNETSGPYFAGEQAVVAVEAKYYAGGPLPNADVNWQVITSPAYYAPPNWPDFTFGTWVPWWVMDSFYGRKPYGPGGYGESKVETFTGKTDAAGEHYLRLDFDTDGGPRPASVQAQATVMDVNRQAWAGSTTLLVHPASLYVGLRSEPVFVERGTPIKVDFIVTDLDGNPVGDRPVQLKAVRLEWKYRDGQWQEEEADVQTCDQGSTDKPVTCAFETPVGGEYRITATVTDPAGRANQSQITRWVSGGKTPPARKVEQEQLTLIPDKETYQPGEMARILVQSPFNPAEGLLTVNRSGLLYTERFQITDNAITLEVPIQEQYIPNVNIQVDLTGSAPRTDDQGQALPDAPPRPAFASGQISLSIPPLQRTLSLEVTPDQKELAPGEETALNITLKDAQGRPVSGAELAVVVVDEAILSLSNYQMADPLGVFYANRPMDWLSVYARSSIVLANPLALTDSSRGGVLVTKEAEAAMDSAGARQMVEAPAAAVPAPAAQPTATASFGAGGAANQPIQVRTNFNPLAIFSPTVQTDANGEARVAVKLPDNLTRYRIMVVAVDAGRQFGSAESSLVARLPLMVRPSAPRFLNFGDAFELPVVLQNQTDLPMVVDVAVRASNLSLAGSAATRVTVPARDRIEVRFPAEAQMAGTARLQVAAVSGAYSDAATIQLPVYTPATTEAFATYGVVDQGAVAQPVEAPEGVFSQYGGLEISTSSTALQALTDAVLYLVSYPFECSEQLASRTLAIASLRDVLTAFNAQGLPSPQEMETSVQRDIETQKTLQNDDGGFPYWRRGQESIPFNTIHVAHALLRAKSKGFNVPEDMQQRALAYLQNIESHYPAWYDADTRRTLSAYALFVRNLAGDKDAAKASRLIDEAGLDKLSLDAVGWLWPVLEDAPGAGPRLDEIRLLVNNRVVETAGAANFTTQYSDQNYLLLGSDRRTDAILLDALIIDDPKHDLIPKLVNGLLAHRTRGRWDSTQENIFVLLALDRYFNTFEAQTPDFVARIWLGDTYAGSHTYQGRTTERHETDIPMPYLVDSALGGGKTQDLTLSKEGTGRLYYRLGLRYAPTSLKMDPLDMGFVVQRTYEALDNPEDVNLDSEGVWHIKAGARVRVRLTMVADNRRYHVALVDPLPAGLEIINPALAVSGNLPQDPNSPDYRYGWWWWGTWYEHQNLRDERAEAFTTLLWDGVFDYSYVTRATTPGRFVVPPAKAEEMYAPEVFGRSGSDIVIVE